MLLTKGKAPEHPTKIIGEPSANKVRCKDIQFWDKGESKGKGGYITVYNHFKTST